MNPDNIIVAGIIAPVIGKFFKSKKGSEHVKVDVRLTYTKRDLFFELSFILLALLTWGFALWIFLKAGFSYRQLFSCIVFTLGGLSLLLLHLFPREVSIPKGKEDLAVYIRCAEATVVNVSLEVIYLKKHRIDIALSDLDL